VESGAGCLNRDVGLGFVGRAGSFGSGGGGKEIEMDGIKSICKMVRRFGWSSMDWKARAGYGQKEILVYLADCRDRFIHGIFRQLKTGFAVVRLK